MAHLLLTYIPSQIGPLLREAYRYKQYEIVIRQNERNKLHLPVDAVRDSGGSADPESPRRARET